MCYELLGQLDQHYVIMSLTKAPICHRCLEPHASFFRETLLEFSGWLSHGGAKGPFMSENSSRETLVVSEIIHPFTTPYSLAGDFNIEDYIVSSL